MSILEAIEEPCAAVVADLIQPFLFFFFFAASCRRRSSHILASHEWPSVERGPSTQGLSGAAPGVRASSDKSVGIAWPQSTHTLLRVATLSEALALVIRTDDRLLN